MLLTTTYKPSKVMFHFIADLLEVRHLTLALLLCWECTAGNIVQRRRRHCGETRSR